MAGSRGGLTRAFRRRLELTVGPDGRPGSDAAGELEVEQLDEGVWLVQRRGHGQLKAARLGPPGRRVHVLRHRWRTRGRFQAVLGHYLCAEQVAWTLRALEVDCVLDVGANEGQFAASLREHGYTGRIVSFEPVPHLVEGLRRKAAHDRDWLVLGCAAGDEDGQAQINTTPGALSSLLPSSEFGREWSDRLRETTTQTIEVRRLDSLFDEAVAGLRAPRVFLKLDTQGYDLAAFRGASGVLDQVVGLQSELSCVPIYEGMPRMPEQLTAYEAEGFETVGMFVVSRDPATMRVIEFDVVMVRPEEVRRP